jgi:hypothetical protein
LKSESLKVCYYRCDSLGGDLMDLKRHQRSCAPALLFMPRWKLIFHLLLCTLLLSGISASAQDHGSWATFAGVGEGCDGAPWAAAIAPNGDLYVGGTLANCANTPSRGVARWNGTAWTALGMGVDGQVFSLAASSSGLYAGGLFTHAGGIPAVAIAFWDGSSWNGLGTMDGSGVSAIAVLGTDVFVAGTIVTSSGTITGVAKWESVGHSWSAVGTGVYADTLAVANGKVYAGGQFSLPGSAAPNNVAVWDGASWSLLGTGFDNQVSALTVSGSLVYAGGLFTHAGSVGANRIAVWNGTAWSALGAGVNKGVLALQVMPDGLYAGGQFTTAGSSSSAAYLARWDGSTWSNVGGGLANWFSSRVVRGLAGSSGTLYVVGEFTAAGGTNAHNVASWNGNSWATLPSSAVEEQGLLSGVTAAVGYGGEHCAGGFLIGAMRCWNGTQWVAKSPGTGGYIDTLVASGSSLYVGGYFFGATGCCFGVWDGTTFNYVGGGTDDEVYAVASSGNKIYVGGFFLHAGDQAAEYAAEWDGTSWHALGAGPGFVVVALAVFNGKLYAGGGGPPYLMVWDGSSWSTLGNLDGGVTSLLSMQGRLYVAGSFTQAGGGTVNGLASWDDTNWSNVGGSSGAILYGVPTGVSALASAGSTLFVAGEFDTIGGVSANNVARWDGSRFTTFGQGSSNGTAGGGVYALGVDGNSIVLGGSFGTAGGQNSANVAVYTPDEIFSGGTFD